MLWNIITGFGQELGQASEKWSGAKGRIIEKQINTLSSDTIVALYALLGYIHST